jgi:sialic acid synthase SpsE
VESKHALKPSYFGARESTPDKIEFSRSIELRAEQFATLKTEAERLGLVFLSTACDTMALDVLVGIGVSAIKIGSSDTNNYPLLRKAAGTKLPIILSTGISTQDDIAGSVGEIRGHGCRELVVLQCTSNYPIEPKDADLRVMPQFAEKFRVPVGFSDHSEGGALACAAVALGASVIEKHFTISRLLPGVDHPASLEPAGMRQMVKEIRAIEDALGQSEKEMHDSEREHLLTMRKSLVAARDLPRGHRLASGDLLVKRPGSGIPPSEIDRTVGKRLKVDLLSDDFIRWDMLEE